MPLNDALGHNENPASKGRYFVVGEADARREASRLCLVKNQPTGHARVELRNPVSEGTPLLELVGCQKLTVFSIPETMERALGKAAMRRAFEVCAQHKNRLRTATRLKREALIVYFDGRQILRLVERTSTYQERKYRSSSKFATAFKLRKTKAEERQVAAYAL